MIIDFKKYYYKLFDIKKYKFLKSKNQIEKNTEIFKKDYEKIIYDILERIKKKKKKKKKNLTSFIRGTAVI